MPTRSGPRGSAAVALIVVVVLLGWAPVAPAAAHDELFTADPSDGGIFETLPSRAILTFTGPVKEVHEVTVTGPDGSVTNGAPTAVGLEVRQTLWAGTDGDYTLTYDVVSADGHEIAGEIQFQVGAVAATGVDEVSAPTSAPAADNGSGAGLVVPGAVLLAGAAGALLLLRHRRVSSGGASTTLGRGPG